MLAAFKTNTYPSRGTAFAAFQKTPTLGAGRGWQYLRTKNLWWDGIVGICDYHPSSGMALAAVQMNRPLRQDDSIGGLCD